MPILLMIIVVVIFMTIVNGDGGTSKPTYRADAIYATNTQVAVWWRQTLTAQVETIKPNNQTISPVLRIEVNTIKQTENGIRATNIYILDFTQKTQTAQAVTKPKVPTATPTLRQPEVEMTP